jgi:hypothetical protein
MSFGWSAGDIAECVKLLIKIGQALKESGGSTDEYQHAVDFLKGVETTVRGVEAIFLNHPNLTFRPAFQEHTTTLTTAITHFRRKTEGYESSLGVNPTTTGAKKAWKKIKLALFEDIEQLKADISYPQSVVNDLIGLQALWVRLSLRISDFAKWSQGHPCYRVWGANSVTSAIPRFYRGNIERVSDSRK